ncbi:MULTISPECIES: AraC family transcriptional regulator [Rhodopseudomonas]|uniref:HTH araC/xylS-type domain-containing protein n=1 Tax=Rhodopseudomonas palustris TaxID=1076 RepID=A0A0D7EXT2_RHOPL|nr:MULTISPECIES: AraC family transcriptional regulator [Rhodopseudomonas]KIZ45355.1 hypothetical protein OO17_07965 [Rhodopseudomonas palustris]MDF3809351.1 AraC family transcriptional regulator [Rhodopseudomonas sp. BAL398]WOK16976.1 AraC family transcriptional regulator [Rhodopseudomonas sp. BAL398]
MDPLTQLVELLRPKALAWKRMMGRGDWAWRFHSQSGVAFGLVVRGACRLRPRDGGERPLGVGDCLFITGPSTWTLQNGDGAPVLDFDDVHPVLPSGTWPETADEGEVHIVGGHFDFDSANEGLLPALLPPIVVVQPGDGEEQRRLTDIFAMIDREASADRPGRLSMLTRLMEMVLIEMLRTPLARAGDWPGGMIAGLADPKIGRALRAFHADVRGDWSVEALAGAAGMSRSRFSRRFMETVGEPPMSYVLHWRMACARDALRAGLKSLDQIAEAIGYGSASAFSTAFSRTMGQSPARYGRESALIKQMGSSVV